MPQRLAAAAIDSRTGNTNTVSIQATNLTNFFLPRGPIVAQSNFATLRISFNISTIFDEPTEVCRLTKIMDEYITQRMKTASLSKPNKKVIFVLKRNLVNLCRDDLEILSQLKEIFGLSQIPLDPRLKNYGNATGALETLRQNGS